MHEMPSALFSECLHHSLCKSLQYSEFKPIRGKLILAKSDQAFWKQSLGCVGLKSLRQRHYQSDLIRRHTLDIREGYSGYCGPYYQLQMEFLSQHLSSPSESLLKMQRAISVTSLNVSITSLGGCIRSGIGFNQSSLG